MVVVDEATYQWIRGIRWDNPSTRSIRERTGDDRVCVGWCNKNQVWFLARVIRQTVKRAFGARDIYDTIELPHIIQKWEKQGVALPMDEAEIAQHLLETDRWNTTLQDEQQRAFDRILAAKEASERQYRVDVALHSRRLIARLGDESGAAYHRPTGNDAKRISSAGLWRRGAAA